jgi:hypothetical protein
MNRIPRDLMIVAEMHHLKKSRQRLMQGPDHVCQGWVFDERKLNLHPQWRDANPWRRSARVSIGFPSEMQGGDSGAIARK